MLINGVAKLLNQFFASCFCHFRLQLVDQIHIIRLGFQPDFYELVHAPNILAKFANHLIVGGTSATDGGFVSSVKFLYVTAPV